MSRTTDQPTRPDKKAEKPGQNESWDESVQDHLRSENEQIVRDRLKTIDKDAETVMDWDKSAFLKRLQPKP